MLGKTKNFLFNLCKKKTILFVFFFSFFGLTFARSASAVGWVTRLAVNVATWPLFQIARILIDLTIFLATFAGSYLNWVLSPNFISYSYTNPANNPIIEVGLGVTQGFVNMILVLILVYIAIATILRLAGYETKKLLITFILVALLVNFAPVICGLIVDASNIIMNFFVQDLEGDAFGNAMSRKVSDIMSGYKETGTYAEAKPYMMQLIVLIPFLLGLTFILFLFASIFVFRYIVIWLLVILSPLAFACYILPVTRKYFDIWWKQFINWSFIGVTCGFFLYLGLLLVTKIQTGTAIGAPTITGQQAPFNSILPFFVSLAFLGIGLVFGLQTSAIGASTVINLTKRTQRWTGRRGKWVAGKTWKGLRPNIDRALYQATEKMRGKGKGFTTRQIAKGISASWAKTPVVRWFLPEPFRKYGQYRPALLSAAKEAESFDSRTLMDDVYTGKAKEEEAAGITYSVLDRVDAQDVFDAGRRAFGEDLSDDELLKNKKFIEITGRFLQIARQSGMLGGGFTRKDPRLAIIAAKKGIKGYGDIKDAAGNVLQGEDLTRAAVRKAVGEARQHIAKWEPEILKNKYVMEAMLGQFDRDRWLQVNRVVKRGQDSGLNGIDSLYSDFTEKDPEFKDLSSKQIEVKLKNLTPKEIEVKVKAKVEAELKKEDLAPEKREKELKIRLAKILPGALQDPRSDESKATWKRFEEHIKKLNKGFEGYAKAVVDKRMQQTGWRAGEYIPKSERWQGKVGTLTPGKATMSSPPPPPLEEKPGASKRPPTSLPGASKRQSTSPPGASKRP